MPGGLARPLPYAGVMWPAEDIPGQWAYVAGACVFVLLSALAWWRGWRYDRARGRPRCSRCGYPVAPDDARAVTRAVGEAARRRSDAPAWACPECGWVPRRAKDLTRTRRSRKWLAGSVLLLLVAVSGWYAIHVQYRRLKLREPLVTAAVPTTWWLLVLPHSQGNVDMIVYHRAYPQGMVSGRRRVRLPGSSRLMPNARSWSHGRYGKGNPDSSSMPGWQHRWATQVFEASMLDADRPGPERADRVWFYSSFTGIDTPAEEQRLLSLLDETDEDLLFAVLDECYDREILSEAAAAAAARAVEETAYTDRNREYAAEFLGSCGPHALPHIERWTSTNAVQPSYYVLDTIVSASLWAQSHGQPIQPHLAEMLKLMFASPWSEHQEYAIILFDSFYPDYWVSPDGFYPLFQLLKPEFERLIRELHMPYRDEAVSLIGSCPECIEFHFGPEDLRTIEAWGWLIEQPGDDVAERAAYGLRDLAWKFGDRDADNAEAFDRLRELVEAALQREQPDGVRVLLRDAEETLRE